MSPEEKLLLDLKGIYGKKITIHASKLAADYTISETWSLSVDTGLEPEEWKALNSGNVIQLKDAPSAVKKAAFECIETYKDLKPDENKEETGNDPLNNLKAGGFEDLPETPDCVDSIPETPSNPNVSDDDKAREFLQQKLQDEAAKLALEDNKRKLEMMEQAEQEGKVPEKKQSESNGFKNGGYDKIKYAKFEEIETPKKVVSRRPGRSIVSLTPRLAECGKIKIGVKGKVTTSQKGNSFRPPQKLDHFIVTTMDKTEGDDFKQDEELMKKIGRWDNFGGYHCTEIAVRLPYDDPSLNFPTSYAYYDSAACQCRGDGETAIRADGTIVDCCPKTCNCIKEKKCKPNGVLSLILDDAPRVGGVYKFRTTGWNSINNLFSSMEFIRGLTNGFLAGLPLMLTLTPKHTTVPGTKTPTVIYMVNLEYRGSLSEMAQAIRQTMDTRALMQYSIRDFEKLAVEAMSLPEAPEECKAIVDEFYPESVKVVA